MPPLELAAQDSSEQATDKTNTQANRKTCSLVEIDLRMNSVTDVGAAALAQALTTNQTLTTLGLKANRIRDEGVASIANALQRETNSTLTSLSLMGNPIQQTGKSVLEKAIFFDKHRRNNRSITRLDILFGNKPWLLAATRMEVPSRLERAAGKTFLGPGSEKAPAYQRKVVGGGLPQARVYNSMAAYYDHTEAPTPVVRALAGGGRKYVISD